LIEQSQSVADREQDANEEPGGGMPPFDAPASPVFASRASIATEVGRATDAERAARATLRRQIAKLEQELSGLLADRFPFLAAPPAIAAAPLGAASGPRLPGLGELEAVRDALAARLQELRTRAAQRGEHERRAQELLERMRLEPGRYRYYRVPVRDLGGTGCGVYEVRPRHGLIGMLAGWWELTLSSGCPLGKGSR